LIFNGLLDNLEYLLRNGALCTVLILDKGLKKAVHLHLNSIGVPFPKYRDEKQAEIIPLEPDPGNAGEGKKKSHSLLVYWFIVKPLNQLSC
jgi:hypothetical protein